MSKRGQSVESTEETPVEVEVEVEVTEETPVEAPKEPRRGVGTVAMEALIAGKTNQEALDIVKGEFPDAHTSMAAINWYRNKMRKDGLNVPTARSLGAEARATAKTERDAEKEATKAAAKAERDAAKAAAKAEKDAAKAAAKAEQEVPEETDEEFLN